MSGSTITIPMNIYLHFCLTILQTSFHSTAYSESGRLSYILGLRQFDLDLRLYFRFKDFVSFYIFLSTIAYAETRRLSCPELFQISICMSVFIFFYFVYQTLYIHIFLLQFSTIHTYYAESRRPSCSLINR